jgi:hypothetical protein
MDREIWLGVYTFAPVALTNIRPTGMKIFLVCLDTNSKYYWTYLGSKEERSLNDNDSLTERATAHWLPMRFLYG